MVKIIAPSVQRLVENEPFKKIELAARTCYQSWDFMQEGSAKKLFKKLLKRKHEAMFEHVNFIFSVETPFVWHTLNNCRVFDQRCFLRFSKIYVNNKFRNLVSGNLRTWRYLFKKFTDDAKSGNTSVIFPALPSELFEDINESNKLVIDCDEVHFKKIDIKDLTEEELLIHHTETYRFVSNRGFTHELVRHRLCSFAQESTRYINYSKKGITVVKPFNFYETLDEIQKVLNMLSLTAENNYNVSAEKDLILWAIGTLLSERIYNDRINLNTPPEFARGNLLIDTKSEIVCTATLEEWKYIFSLRISEHAHPMIRNLMEIVKGDLQSLYKITL